MLNNERLAALETELLAAKNSDGYLDNNFISDGLELLAEVKQLRKQLEQERQGNAARSPTIQQAQPSNWYCSFCMYPFRSDKQLCPLCNKTDPVKHHRQE